MKRLTAIIAAALVAAAFGVWGVAASGGNAADVPAASNARLPALPSEVRQRGRWIIGVKCDFPPFGYINVRGQHAGYDVEVAERFAQLAFGSKKKLTMTCVTTPSRIPALQAKRVDIIISTLTYTKARDEIIDYSIPYYSATGRLLVKKSSNLGGIRDLGGKTVSTTTGSIYDRWMRNCFSNTRRLTVDSTTSALAAVKDGRADTFMFDDALLLYLVTTDADKELKLLRDKFLEIPWGIGIRQGETAMKRWVDARIRLMKSKGEFLKILKNNAPKSLVDDFKGNVPGKKTNFGYPTGDPESACP